MNDAVNLLHDAKARLAVMQPLFLEGDISPEICEGVYLCMADVMDDLQTAIEMLGGKGGGDPDDGEPLPEMPTTSRLHLVASRLAA